MAISYPFDLLDSFPGWSTEFDLMYRQEYSRTSGGLTIAKDMGTPLWKAAFQSVILQPNELDIWRARLSAMDGSIHQFSGRPMSRCFPIAYPNGVGIGDVSEVTIEGIGANNKSLALQGLPIWYSLTIGDYLQIGTKLYQAVEGTVANSFGRTTHFELRPHLAPGTANGNVVILIKPSVPMIITPGSLTTSAELSTGRGTIMFQAIESR